MRSDWFNGIEMLQGRWQHGGKVGYCYTSGLEKTLCKWDIYVPLVTKGLIVWISSNHQSDSPVFTKRRRPFFSGVTISWKLIYMLNFLYN